MRFLLVDRIDQVEANARITGHKNVAMSEDYLEWHFPEQPILPGVLMLESCAQLAGWLEAASSDFERWVLLDRVHAAKYVSFVVPGDRVVIELEQLSAAEERRHYKATCSVDGQPRAQIEFEGRAVPLADLEDGARARRTYAALRGSADLRARMEGRGGQA